MCVVCTHISLSIRGVKGQLSVSSLWILEVEHWLWVGNKCLYRLSHLTSPRTRNLEDTITDIFPRHDSLFVTYSVTGIVYIYVLLSFALRSFSIHQHSSLFQWLCSHRWQDTEQLESHSTSWYPRAVNFLSKSTQTVEKHFLKLP